MTTERLEDLHELRAQLVEARDHWKKRSEWGSTEDKRAFARGCIATYTREIADVDQQIAALQQEAPAHAE